MTVGLHAVNYANKCLDVISGTTFTGLAASALKLHTGDPGAAGTTAASAETTRKALTWAAAASGSKAINGTLPSWPGWTAGAETISHVSMWDSTTAGVVILTGALSAAKPMTNGDTLNITAMTVSYTPIMA